jgi:hypothetical protein
VNVSVPLGSTRHSDGFEVGEVYVSASQDRRFVEVSVSRGDKVIVLALDFGESPEYLIMPDATVRLAYRAQTCVDAEPLEVITEPWPGEEDEADCIDGSLRNPPPAKPPVITQEAPRIDNRSGMAPGRSNGLIR